jgi:hypothetical protein
VNAFSAGYVTDWNLWLEVRPRDRAALFGVILRRWQATRPRPMRRTRLEAGRKAPVSELCPSFGNRPPQRSQAAYLSALPSAVRSAAATTMRTPVFGSPPPSK